MQTTTHQWHRDPRVTALLASMITNPPAMQDYDDWSISSWGKKTYQRYVGSRVAALNAIRSEYLERAFAIEETEPQAFRIAAAAPNVKDAIDHALGRWVDYHCENRAAYLAECEAALPKGIAA